MFWRSWRSRLTLFSGFSRALSGIQDENVFTIQSLGVLSHLQSSAWEVEAGGSRLCQIWVWGQPGHGKPYLNITKTKTNNNENKQTPSSWRDTQSERRLFKQEGPRSETQHPSETLSICKPRAGRQSQADLYSSLASQHSGMVSSTFTERPCLK